MRHEKTKTLVDYWMTLMRTDGMRHDAFGRRVWPERSAIQPMQCASILGDMFILDLANGASHYRLAGTRLCAMLGRELKGEDFSTAFVDADQHAAESWATGLRNDDYAVLICGDGKTKDGRLLPLETLLLPLSHRGARDERAVGLTVPLETPHWLSALPISEIAIRSVRVLRPWELEEDGQSPVRRPAKGVPHLAAPALDMESAAPLVDEDGRVRSAPWLRVLSGGRKS